MSVEIKPSCDDCGIDYQSLEWADVVIPDAIWKRISQNNDEGGLLCFNCMNKRLKYLGLTNVPFQITSGPFAFLVR